MKALLDSSVLVAAHLPAHPDHLASSAWLRQATVGAYELIVAAHSLAEVYAVLTRLPLRPPISPKAARQFLDQNVLRKGSVVALSPDLTGGKGGKSNAGNQCRGTGGEESESRRLGDQRYLPRGVELRRVP